ncbi:MAG: hypothetical protein KDK37_16800, partial [Leptospiraceae bacterium]|nr:hypothetical protein [Leptospiraceae bacterium]
FSDDSLRHELDGYYILRNLPLYCMSPLELGSPGAVPNHPNLATIYLPGTQLLAFLGALSTGYRSIFVITSLIMMAWLLRRRRMYSLLFAHPLLMIVFFSGHVDLTALLLCLIAVEIALKQREATTPNMRRVFLMIVPGVFWILACAMKPEALLVLLPLIAIWLSSTRSRISAMAGFCVGAFVTAGFLFYFTIYDLFHIGDIERLGFFSTSEGSSLEFECFFYTAKIFSDYFVAYRPDAMLLVDLGLSSSESIRLVRMIWLPAWALLTGWFTWSRILLGRQKIPGSEGSTAFLFLVRLSLELAAVLLIGYFLFRGSWQPWYFLWFLVALPLLQGSGGLRWALFALSLLLLFYLPVIKYRVDGSFDLSFFYMSFLLASTGGAMVYFWNKKSAYGK